MTSTKNEQFCAPKPPSIKNEQEIYCFKKQENPQTNDKFQDPLLFRVEVNVWSLTNFVLV